MKNFEDESEVSMDMLCRALDALDTAVYTFGPDRKVIYANRAAAKKLGLRSAEGNAVGAAEANHFAHNKYYDEAGNELTNYPNGSAVDAALKGITTYDLLLEHRNIKEYTQEWIQLSCVPVFDAAGSFEYGILWYRDVTLRKSRADKLRFLIESSKILSVTTEFEDRLHQKAKLVVPSLADWCAIDILVEENTIKRVTTVHRHPEKLEWLKTHEQKYPKPAEATIVESVVRSGKAYFMPRVTEAVIDAAPNLTNAQRQDIQRLKLSSLMVIPIGVGGKIFGALTLAHAESNRVFSKVDLDFFKEFCSHLSVLMENAKLYKDIKERDLAKDAFLASLSHELRNPLAPIKSAVELLRLKNSNDELGEEIDVIEHQFDHMTRLLKDLLDSTRFTRGKIKLAVETVELNGTLRHVVKAVEAPAKKSGITLLVTYPTEPLHVSVDKTRLEQALSNILHNAVKFTPMGGTISISVRVVHDAEHELKSVQIVIQDSGAGITASEMKHIFEPYYQSDRVRNSGSGLGIGLPLVHEIVQLLGGAIEVRSDGEGRGSTFEITLPLVANPSETETEEALLAQRTPQTTTQAELDKHAAAQISKNILVVDDNRAATDALVRLLRASGWVAEGQYSAADALRYLETNATDIIFLDVGMPEMNGYEMAGMLRQRGFQNPIIALTGYGMQEDREKAFAAGFTAHLTKPVSLKEVREALLEFL